MDERRATRGEGVICASVDGEVVALNIEKGVCYGLDAIGSAVWDLLAEPRTLSELCAALTARYRVDAETCRRDVAALLSDLGDEGLAVFLPAAPDTGATL